MSFKPYDVMQFDMQRQDMIYDTKQNNTAQLSMIQLTKTRVFGVCPSSIAVI